MPWPHSRLLSFQLSLCSLCTSVCLSLSFLSPFPFPSVWLSHPPPFYSRVSHCRSVFPRSLSTSPSSQLSVGLCLFLSPVLSLSAWSLSCLLQFSVPLILSLVSSEQPWSEAWGGIGGVDLDLSWEPGCWEGEVGSYVGQSEAEWRKLFLRKKD